MKPGPGLPWTARVGQLDGADAALIPRDTSGLECRARLTHHHPSGVPGSRDPSNGVQKVKSPLKTLLG